MIAVGCAYILRGRGGDPISHAAGSRLLDKGSTFIFACNLPPRRTTRLPTHLSEAAEGHFRRLLDISEYWK